MKASNVRLPPSNGSGFRYWKEYFACIIVDHSRTDFTNRSQSGAAYSIKLSVTYLKEFVFLNFDVRLEDSEMLRRNTSGDDIGFPSTGKGI